MVSIYGSLGANDEETLGTEDLWDECEKSVGEMLRDLVEEFAQQARDGLPRYMAPRPGENWATTHRQPLRPAKAKYYS